MARDITAGLQAETEARVAYPLFLWIGEFDSGPVPLWNGLGTLPWNGIDWTGSGTLWNIQAAAENAKIQAEGAKFTLSGLSQDVIEIAENEDYSGRTCRLYVGGILEDGTVVPEPTLLFEGVMDVMESEEDGETARIVMTAESELVSLEIPNEWRYTHEDQQQFGGLAEALGIEDNFLSKVASLQEAQVEWG